MAGTFGLGDIKRSSVPTLVTALNDMKVLDISSGYCHSCAVVTWDHASAESVESEAKSLEFEQKIQSFPIITQSAEEEEEEEGTSKKKRGAAGGTGKKGQTQSKRGRKK